MPHPTNDRGGSETRRHLRGSSILLGGRMIAILLNFVVQVLTVRFLAKGDYGAFAWAISIVGMGSIICQMGLNKGIARLVPIYYERGDRATMFGALLMAMVSVVAAGSLFAILAFAFEDALAGDLAGDPLSVSVLLVLVALCPLQALDDLFLNMLAIFSGARAIFFRRHLMPPLLRLSIILAVMAAGGGVHALATGYLLAGIAGTATYVPLVLGALRRKRLLEGIRLRSLRFPRRELLASSLPMITTDLYVVIITTTATLILESYRGPAELAEFRAVIPVAGLNLVVFQSFKLLYLPSAARLFARNDRAGLNEIYWKSSLWITLLTFPVFAAATFLSEPLTVLLFGPRYADAALFLAILSCGNFFNVATGLNGDTLQVHGGAGFLASTNLIAGMGNILLDFLLIPPYGGTGAALATAGSIIISNVLNQAGLIWKTGIRLRERAYLRIYLRLALIIAGLFGLKALRVDWFWVAGAILIASLALIRWSSKSLDLAGNFPEMSRIPVLRKLLVILPSRAPGPAEAKEAVE